jgi:hypothetical protein
MEMIRILSVTLLFLGAGGIVAEGPWDLEPWRLPMKEAMVPMGIQVTDHTWTQTGEDRVRNLTYLVPLTGLGLIGVWLTPSTKRRKRAG